MKRQHPLHILHLILTVLTGGLWLPIWVLCAVSASMHNAKVDQAERAEELQLLRDIRQGRR